MIRVIGVSIMEIFSTARSCQPACDDLKSFTRPPDNGALILGHNTKDVWKVERTGNWSL